MRNKKSVVLCALLLVVLLGTSCGGLSDDSQQEAKIAVIANYNAPITDWDPSIAYSSEIQVLHNMYETLLRYEPDTNTFKPVLAESYTKSDDGLNWTFKLREGVKFHDGTECNAEAVKFSIDRNKDYKKGAAYIWDPLENIVVVDEYTVQFSLNRPAPLDLIVASGFDAFIYSPSAVGPDYSKGTDWFAQGKEAGSGPYMLQSQTQGNELVLTRFEDYWGGWEGSHFDKAVYKRVQENASRRQMIEGGEADAVGSLMSDDLRALQDNPKVVVNITDSYKHLMCLLDAEKPPLDNKLVRQALAFAFPYQKVVDFVTLDQFSSMPKDTLFPAEMLGATDSIPYTYNLDRAKELLTQAGYPEGGFEISITHSAGNEELKKILELWKSELAQIGIVLTIQGMPFDSMDALKRNVDPGDRQHIISMTMFPDIITPMCWYGQFIKTGGPCSHYSYYNNEEFDQKLDAANTMSGIDLDRSIEMFNALNKEFAEECISINFVDKKHTIVLDSNFKGYKQNPAYTDVIFLYECYRED